MEYALVGGTVTPRKAKETLKEASQIWYRYLVD
jgi:hypothetical protein